MRKQAGAKRNGAVGGISSPVDLGFETTFEMSMEDPGDCLSRMAEAAGFDYYLLTSFPRGDCSGFLDNCIATNWPTDLLAFYETADVFYCCGLIAKLKSTIMPVFCDSAPFESTAANQEERSVTTCLRDYGLKSTLGFTLHDADLRQYVFAFSGDGAMPSREEATTQIVRAIEFLESFRHQNPVEQPAENLSGREVECLRWSAAGKSSEEIAIILELSSHTVVGYLKSAMRKLNSVSRMQAVARAYRYRLL